MLLVGAAKVSINPTGDILPFDCWGGMALTAIHSNCYVRACVIDNGKTQALILGYDLGMPPEGKQIKPLLARETGISEKQIFLSATHNHTTFGPGFETDEESRRKRAAYDQLVTDATVQAVKQAKATLRPAKYGYGTGKSYINMNRDYQVEDGSYVQAPSPESYSDKNVYLMKFVDEEGKLICAVSNYGMHATLGFLQTDVDGQLKISSNIPGAAAEYVEARYGNDAVLIWTSGASGDQNPVLFCMRDYEADGFPAMAQMLPGMQYQLITLLGKQHGVDICKGLESITFYRRNMPMRFGERTLLLPGQKPPKGADMAKNRAYINRQIPLPEGESLVQMEDADPVSMTLREMILGDIAFIGVAEDLYSLLGKACLDASPYRNTMLVVHNDDSPGYIVDRTGANHQTFQCFGAVKPGAADEIIVAGVKALFDELLGE